MKSSIIQAENTSFISSNDDILFEYAGKTYKVSRARAAFPLSAPYQMISIRGQKGKEIGVIDNFQKLDEQSQKIVYDLLEKSYFMPFIINIRSVKEDLGITTWNVTTDKGEREFDTRGVQRNIRKLGGRRLLIKDVDGNRYEIKDWANLPIKAQRILADYI
jgi:hypothetical protein